MTPEQQKERNRQVVEACHKEMLAGQIIWLCTYTHAIPLKKPAHLILASDGVRIPRGKRSDWLFPYQVEQLAQQVGI